MDLFNSSVWLSPFAFKGFKPLFCSLPHYPIHAHARSAGLLLNLAPLVLFQLRCQATGCPVAEVIPINRQLKKGARKPTPK